MTLVFNDFGKCFRQIENSMHADRLVVITDEEVHLLSKVKYVTSKWQRTVFTQSYAEIGKFRVPTLEKLASLIHTIRSYKPHQPGVFVASADCYTVEEM